MARELEAQGRLAPDEAKLRSALSRAYYAAFRTAGSYLKSQGDAPPNLSAHKYVSDQFKAFSDPVRYSIGENLSRMGRLRNQADYEDFFRGDLAKQTRQVLIWSEDVIAKVRAL